MCTERSTVLGYRNGSGIACCPNLCGGGVRVGCVGDGVYCVGCYACAKSAQSLDSVYNILFKTFYAGTHDLLDIVVILSGGHESSIFIIFYT